MDTSKKRIILVHHHIFKNAGTSFNYALRQAFVERFSEYDLPDGDVINSDVLAQYLNDHSSIVALSGHHISLDICKIDEVKILSSILIRKPLERILSIYRFERTQEAQTEGALMAKKLNFKEFVLWRLDTTPQVFCNYQTLYCSRQGHTKADYLVTLEDFDLACRNLDKCFAVGTVEEYKKFLTLVQYETREYFEDTIFKNSHLNVTSKNTASKKAIPINDVLIEKLGEKLVCKLIELNQFDDKLHEYATEKMFEWFARDVEKKYEYYYSLGELCSEKNKWRDTISLLQSAIEIKPFYFKLYFRLAEAFEKIGDIRKAIIHYEKAIVRNQDFPWSYYRLGAIYFTKSRYREAANYYRQAIKFHPTDKCFEFFMALGDTLVKLNQIDQAIEIYLRAQEIQMNMIEVNLKLSWAYFKQNNIVKSDYYSSLFLNNSPDKCTAYIKLGDIYFSGSAYELALKYYSNGIKEDQNNELCQNKIASVLNRN